MTATRRAFAFPPLLLVCVCAGPLAACKSGGLQPSPPPGATIASIAVTSKSFASSGSIPVDNTCDGADRSPQVTWSAPPAGTKSLAILMEDPDAPGGDFTHWIVFNIRPDALSIAEATDLADAGSAVLGINGFNRASYSGPCPPKMELHRYFLRVFALDTLLPGGAGSNREAIDSAMSGHVLAEGALMGTFSR
jgi:Raf kinase inhibitor-like YbhB/YbcL family protein